MLHLIDIYLYEFSISIYAELQNLPAKVKELNRG